MRKISYFLFAVAFVITCSSAFSQSFIMVMKVKDGTTTVNGGSIVAGHGGEIDISSYSQGENVCAGCGKATLSDFKFMTSFNASTIAFKKFLLTGKKLTSVDVTYLTQGPTPFTFLKIHMENVIVTSEEESGFTGGDKTPTVAISLSYSRIAWQRISQHSDGSIGTKTTYGWDVAANTTWSYTFP
jgi:type VI secretion system secreted protein Hcp